MISVISAKRKINAYFPATCAIRKFSLDYRRGCRIPLPRNSDRNAHMAPQVDFTRDDETDQTYSTFKKPPPKELVMAELRWGEKKNDAPIKTSNRNNNYNARES